MKKTALRTTLALCLTATLFLSACTQSHNCEEPEIYQSYDLAAQGDTVYFSAFDKLWCHQPGDKEPTELAQFRGLFFQTPHGLYCFDEYCTDENAPDVYQVSGTELIPVTNLPAEARRLTILDVTDGAVYWSSADQIWSEEEGSRIPTYRTDCATGETSVIFAAPDIQPPQRMADGKLWFTAKGGIFQYYDMETEEVVTYCNSFWSYQAEPYTIFYYDDFILCYCIQYEPNDQGTHDVKGYCYYRLNYGSSEPVYLTEYDWYSYRPWLLDDTLYYPSYDGSEKNHLVALDPRTGQVTKRTDQPFDTRELAVTHQGFYYTENYDLYCYDYSTGESLLVVDKED